MRAKAFLTTAVLLFAASCGNSNAGPASVEIVRIAPNPGHIDVEARVDAPSKENVLPAIATAIRRARGNIDAEVLRAAGDLNTVGFHIRYKGPGDKEPRGAEPLADFNYTAADFLQLGPNTPAAVVFNSAERARARPPAGDLLIQAECQSGDYALQASKLCLDADGVPAD